MWSWQSTKYSLCLYKLHIISLLFCTSHLNHLLNSIPYNDVGCHMFAWICIRTKHKMWIAWLPFYHCQDRTPRQVLPIFQTHNSFTWCESTAQNINVCALDAHFHMLCGHIYIKHNLLGDMTNVWRCTLFTRAAISIYKGVLRNCGLM